MVAEAIKKNNDIFVLNASYRENQGMKRIPPDDFMAIFRCLRELRFRV
jgi:hypothetical protein